MNIPDDDFDAADLRAVAASNTDQLVLVVPGGQLDHGDGQLEGLANVVLQVLPGPATSRRSRGKLPVGSKPARQRRDDSPTSIFSIAAAQRSRMARRMPTRIAGPQLW